MKSRVTSQRATVALVAAGALLLVAFAGAQQANALTIYACVKKNGTPRVFTKKPKCKKGESALSWNMAGLPGKNGANGANGAAGKEGPAGKDGSAGKEGGVGKEGAPGQPQSAMTFNASSEAPFLEKKFTSLFALGGVSVQLDCANALIANVTTLEASGPAGTRVESGMTDSRANNKEAVESFQQLVYNSAVTSGTSFASLVTNGSGEKNNVGHVNATITTSGAVIFIDAFIEVGVDPKACTVSGSAFSIPT